MTETERDVTDRIWKIADNVDPCLLVTRAGDGQRVRPVFGRVRRDEGRIYVLTDTRGEKLDQIAAHPRVSLAFADIRANDYVVIEGTARILDDRAKIEELWRFSDESFWQSPDNPDLRAIAIEPDGAELWDGSNVLVTGAKVLAERLVGARVELVENAKVETL
jgi:general stress protein 26